MIYKGENCSAQMHYHILHGGYTLAGACGLTPILFRLYCSATPDQPKCSDGTLPLLYIATPCICANIAHTMANILLTIYTPSPWKEE